jgi:hypothetical protein
MATSIMRILSTLLIIGLLFSSCSQDAENTADEGREKTDTRALPNSTGKLGEIVVVVSDNAWESDGLDVLNTALKREVEGLPQPEPQFSVAQINQSEFSRIFRTTRNLVLIEKSDVDSVFWSNDKYSRDQLVLNIAYTTPENARKMIIQKGNTYADYFYQRELDRLKEAHKLARDNGIGKTIRTKFGVEIYIPKDFRVNQEEDGFIWLIRNKRDIQQGIFIYELGMQESLDPISTALMSRDSVSSKYIFGELDNTYMQLEMRYSPITEVGEVDGVFQTQMLGLWRMANDFMGGPFVNYTFFDDPNDRLVGIDGYVYSPGTEKRNLMWELRAIVESARLVK